MAYGPPPWRKLKSGLLAIALVVIGAISIIAFARVGSLRGKTYVAYILATDASGIFKGTDVWLLGQKVGVVQDVGFRSLSTDTAVQTVLKMEIMSPYQPYIRRDSRVEFKPGGTYIGAQVVALSVGSASTPALRPGDTLTRVSVIDPDLRSNELAAAGRDLPQIVSSLRAIGTDLSRTSTQVDKMGERSAGLEALAKRMSTIESRERNGTLARLLGHHALLDSAQEVLVTVDSLLRYLDDGHGTVSRIRTDPALRRGSANARAALDSLKLRITREEGTAGRVLDDDALRRDIEELRAQLARTAADIGKKPARYSPF
jgi:phospholipid/cholesterol/gamma-HCH transport system substrate-binding protein